MNIKFRVLKPLLYIFIFTQPVFGQFYQTGQPPSSVKWKQINTTNFRLIFPDSFESQSLKLAVLLEEARDLTGHSLDHQPGKIPVIIHNHNSRANGMVIWAPKRMELYPTPSQIPRGGDWLTQLVVHEQRHVVQLDKLDQGITSALGLLIGEQAVGLAAGRLPLWFLEGDAVTAETVLTMSGRGRMASFDMPLRALLLSDSLIYGYDKFLFGSFKDYVPDYYIYGYHMVSQLRRDHGSHLWINTLEHTGRKVVYPAPFSRSLRQETGENLRSLHQTIMSRLRNEWDSAFSHYVIDQHSVVNTRDNSAYHNYLYPVWETDSTIISIRTGLGQTPELVRINMEGKTSSIHYPGTLSSPSFTVSGTRLAWSEYRSDIRWGLRQYSIINVLDMTTGRTRSISSKSRYFSPSFAPDGLFLAVIEVDAGNNGYLLLINSVTGELAARFDAPEQKNLQLPVFSHDGGEIFVAATGEEGTSIISLDIANGEWREIIEPEFVHISGLFPCDSMVCFNSDMQGIDNIYAFDYSRNELLRVTGSRFGAKDGSISPSGSMIAWSDYSASGSDLAIAPFDPAKPANYDSTIYSRDYLIQNLALHEKGIAGNPTIDSLGWYSEKYRKGLNLFRFHSWSPFYYDYRNFNITEQPVYPGFTLLSQNLLNTADTYLGYSYKEGRHIAHGNFAWKGWYPVLEAGFEYGDEPGIFRGRDTLGPSDKDDYGLLSLNGQVYLPLNLSEGNYIAGFEPRIRIRYNNSLYHYESDNSYKRGMTTVEAGFLAYRYRRMSPRDLAPLWGQVLRWQSRSAPFESENLGTINALELTLYTPGIFPHHSLRIDIARQSQNPVKYYYSSLVRFPRGYTNEASEILKLLKSTYSFPLFYPDMAIPGVLYLKRLHGALFADIGVNGIWGISAETGRREWREEKLFSWGGTLTVNYHFLRIPFPFNTTGGFAYIPEKRESSFLFSFGINLNI